jgi:hypothetical protein
MISKKCPEKSNGEQQYLSSKFLDLTTCFVGVSFQLLVQQGDVVASDKFAIVPIYVFSALTKAVDKIDAR